MILWDFCAPERLLRARGLSRKGPPAANATIAQPCLPVAGFAGMDAYPEKNRREETAHGRRPPSDDRQSRQP
ncbi:MAG: hypothetical protein Tsb0032_22100 [Kiloniellaceae bacterium]